MKINHRLKKSIINIVGKENIEFLSHARNYVSADFFTKGLTFISIPVFTRLLTPSDYGILSIFTSIISIFTILLGLNIKGSVLRYYHEENNEFYKFLGSNLIFIIIFNISTIGLIYMGRYQIANFFSINSYLFMIAISISFLTIPIDIFLNYLQTKKQSKKYSFISVVRSSLILVVSIVWMYVLNKNRYLGKVYAQLIVILVISLMIIYKLIKKADFKFNLKYIKYSLKFGIPLIPHALSGFILASFDTIIINQLTGAVNTGLYSFAYKIGMIMNVIVMAMNRSWVPIFYKNLKENNYSRINDLAVNYSKYIYCGAIALILFSREIIVIMADKSYYSALSIVPVIVLGYVALFLYTLYGNYSFYRKKTGLISIATLIAGLINIGLNYWLIPIVGYQVAAYTTFFSFFILFIFHYINVKFILEEKVISLKSILPGFLIVLIISGLYMVMLSSVSDYFILLILKLIIFMISIHYFIFKN